MFFSLIASFGYGMIQYIYPAAVEGFRDMSHINICFAVRRDMAESTPRERDSIYGQN